MINEKTILLLQLTDDSNNSVSFTVKPTFDSPAAWGLLLVDIAYHVANAYNSVGDFSKTEVLELIKDMFDKEWENPTDEHQGNLLI